MRAFSRYTAILLGCCLLLAPAGHAASASTVTVPAGSVAYIGCSNTWMSVQGYDGVSKTGGVFWPIYDTGGGSIGEWANPYSSYWAKFNQLFALHKAQLKSVWVQLCDNVLQSPSSYPQVQAMFSNLKANAPGLRYYVSAINTYSPVTMCALMGSYGQGVTDTQTWASQAVKSGLALAGPSMGLLTPSTTTRDGCHPNTGGMTLLGNELAGFFG